MITSNPIRSKITFNYFYSSRKLITNNIEILETLQAKQLELQQTGSNCLVFEIPQKATNKINEIVPCFSLITDKPYSYNFSITAYKNDTAFNASLLAVGESVNKTEVTTENIKTDIDAFVLKESFDKIFINLHINTEVLLNQDWFISICCKGNEHVAHYQEESYSEKILNVPSISQMQVPEIGTRICSATCLSMTIQSYDKKITTEQLAKLSYCKEYDLYGVWPQNIYAVSRFGFLGSIFFFSDFNSAIKILEKGIPLSISIRYGKGELTNCALERETTKPAGHFILLKGINDNYVIVNDPAATDTDTVSHKYLLSEFRKLWLERSQMAYVIFPNY